MKWSHDRKAWLVSSKEILAFNDRHGWTIAIADLVWCVSLPSGPCRASRYRCHYQLFTLRARDSSNLILILIKFVDMIDVASSIDYHAAQHNEFKSNKEHRQSGHRWSKNIVMQIRAISFSSRISQCLDRTIAIL